MKKVLVSLISDQTIPNIEFIKEKKNEVDEFLFISTESMERKDTRNWILNSVKLDLEKILDPVIVDPFSFEDIEEKLDKAVSDDFHYIVNLTGGTKIMSLSTHDFFKKLDAEMYYVTGKGSFIKIHPGRKKIIEAIKSIITLEEYVTAYGFSIKKKEEPLLPFEENEKMLHYFLNNFNSEIDNPVLENLRVNYRGKKLNDLDKVSGLKQLIERIGISLTNKESLTEYETKYLTGEWLEEYLYHFIIREFKIHTETIGLGLQLMKNKVGNEMDVLLMKNNKLYLFECKTSIFTDLEEKNTFIGQTIYKSDSLRNKFGLFTQTVIVTLSDLSKPRLKPHIDRAEASKVKLIGRKEFQEGLKDALIAV